MSGSGPAPGAVLAIICAAIAACSSQVSTDPTAPGSPALTRSAEQPAMPVTQPETSALPAGSPGSTLQRRATTATSPIDPEPGSTVTSTGEDAAGCLALLPSETLAAQLVWPAVYGDELTSQAQEFADWGVGGALLMTWPDGARSQELRDFKRTSAIPLLVATDEEGGDVQRFRRLGELPSQREVAATMSVEDAEQMIADHAAALDGAGVDIVFGPVVDVAPADGSAGPMSDRVFSPDPEVVAGYAAAYVNGWNRAGILPVLKHFPGHGSASADTHVAVASTPSLDELASRDLVPYRRLADEQVGVLVGHLDVPGLTDASGMPASLSPEAITNLLADELGFAGHLVFTDALDMDAVTTRMSLPEAAERAVAAGADVVIFTEPSATPEVIARLTEAVDSGRLPLDRFHAAAQRVLDTKEIDPCALTA